MSSRELEDLRRASYKDVIPPGKKFIAEFSDHDASEIACDTLERGLLDCQTNLRENFQLNTIDLGENLYNLNIDGSIVRSIVREGSSIVMRIANFTCQIREDNEQRRELYCRNWRFWSDAKKLLQE